MTTTTTALDNAAAAVATLRSRLTSCLGAYDCVCTAQLVYANRWIMRADSQQRRVDDFCADQGVQPRSYLTAVSAR